MQNHIRRPYTCDPALKLLNEEITSDIQKHKQNIWKEHLDAHWDHRHNTHTLWKTIHGLSNRAPPHTLNTSITFNNKGYKQSKNNNSQGPELNIRHLKHIGPLGLAFLTSMFKSNYTQTHCVLFHQTFQAQSLSSSQTTSSDAKPTQHI